MKKLKLKNCIQCPYFFKDGPYGKVMYKPMCIKGGQGKVLPYDKVESKSKRFYAQPTYIIPNWCSLDDY